MMMYQQIDYEIHHCAWYIGHTSMCQICTGFVMFFGGGRLLWTMMTFQQNLYFGIALYHIVLYVLVWYYIMLYCIVLYCIAFGSVVLHVIMCYYIVSYGIA